MRYQKFDLIKDGLQFKLIIGYSGSEIVSLMEKPKSETLFTGLHISGAHMFALRPDQNHFDHWNNGSNIKERGNLNFPYEIYPNGIVI